MAGGEEAMVPAGCGPALRALTECHRRVGGGVRQRELTCRHLNRALAECIVAACCPEEAEAVRSLCSSAGTAMKRTQCQGAKISLAACISAHQDP